MASLGPMNLILVIFKIRANFVSQVSNPILIIMNKIKRQSHPFKYLRYSCEASDFGHKRDDTVQNFVKTESFRPRKTSWNTVNFR